MGSKYEVLPVNIGEASYYDRKGGSLTLPYTIIIHYSLFIIHYSLYLQGVTPYGAQYIIIIVRYTNKPQVQNKNALAVFIIFPEKT